MEKFMIILAIISIVILHSFIALYIDRLNRIKGNSSTNWGLIPFTNIYLLGELLFNKLVGVILFIGSILSIDYHVTLLGNRYGFDIIPNGIRIALFTLMLIITIGLIIYSAIKCREVIKNNSKYEENDLIFFIKETLWILVLILVIYFFFIIIKKYSV